MQNNSMTLDLQAKGRAAFLILLQTVNDLTVKQENAPPFFNAIFETIREDIFRTAERFPIGDAVKMLEHREKLIAALRKLHAVTIYADIARDWLTHGIILYHSVNDTVEPIADGQVLFNEHLQAMISIGNGESQITENILQQSMAYIPLRMATIKYKNYVSDSVKIMELPLNAGNAEGFARFFNPMDFLKGEDWLAELIAPVDKAWHTDCTAINNDIFIENSRAVMAVRKELVEAVDLLCALFDAVTAAYISLTQINGEHDPDALRKLTEQQLDEAIDSELKNVVYGSDRDKLPEDTEWLKINTMFYETGLDYFIVMERPGGQDKEDMNGFLDAFLPYLDATNMAPNRRRFLRQHLMAYLSYPYNMEDYKNYFIGVYNALDETNKRYLCNYVSHQKNMILSDKK